MPTPSRRIVRPLCPATIALIAICLTGCAKTHPLGQWTGPTVAPPASVQPWTYGDVRGRVLISPDYRIYTTLDTDADLDAKLPRLMEGALDQYQSLSSLSRAPSLKSQPMQCFLFGRREEWADFTARNTGQDASIYLQINRGGYTVGDRYVAYYIGDLATYSVAAHEGWHQYCARNFKGRLPPFLEEGIACLFESVRWENDLPRWNLSINQNRAQALREAIDAKRLFPLKQLITTHAGQIVDGPPADVEAFYAQSWAFARFCREAEGGKYRDGLNKLIADTAAGTVKDPTGSHQRSDRPWNSQGVKPTLETYLNQPMDQIDVAYRTYLHRIAFEEFSAQWRSEPGSK